MIPRRIYEHVKAHNWFAVAIDFVIVVAGVFVGLQVQEWNTARQPRAKAEVFTARLIDDLRYEAWAYESLVQYHYDIRANARRATDSLTSAEVLTDEQLLTPPIAPASTVTMSGGAPPMTNWSRPVRWV